MVEDFELLDYRGQAFRLADHAEADVVVLAFTGTECPLAKLYAPRLVELAGQYAGDRVLFVAINSNVQDSVTELAHYARIHEIEFPVLKDVGNEIADKLGARRTPEVFVLDRQRHVRYAGCIDDQYDIGIKRESPEHAYLKDAIDAILAGQEVATPSTNAVGCVIGRVRDANDQTEVTYANQISRILQKRCIQCHREGEIAPFALTNYDEVYGWAEMIDEVVQDQRMPPWNADPAVGRFRNDPSLSEEERRLIHEWMLAGAPLGDESQLPPPREFPETGGWRIGEPDVVIPITEKPFKVPAEGAVDYQYFVVDPGFTEDKWIQAAECRPGNREVVHHILVFVKPPGDTGRGRGGTIRSDWLAATAPGAEVMKLPVGLAKFVPAGAKLVFQLHYTPNGSPQEDISELGLIFADPTTVRREVGTWRAVNNRFVIPPNEPNHVVEADHTFERDAYLLALFPHMHLRGKSFRYVAKYPDGKEEVLLHVPRYDFNWQNSYILAMPKRLPKGTKLHCTAVFDNSANNLANPDPSDTVRWGDQTWEEMMIGYFSMIWAEQDLQAGGKLPEAADGEADKAN
jgi:peroxiredoxin/mono/diheme cytochrome c family protein